MFIRFFLQILIFWFNIHLVHYLLLYFQKTKRPYNNFLRLFGCRISLFNIGFYTTSFNRLFYRIGTKNRCFYKIWFTLGIIIACLLAACACIILICLPIKYVYDLYLHSVSSINSSTYQHINKANEGDQLLIQPIIPGVNVPLEQMIHFFLALLLSTVFHELGHAIAASTENVRVNGCGYFLFFLYPGAYVDLNHEQVQMISAYRQLRIYCAGVFHNIVLVVIAMLFLYVHPVFLKNFFTESATVYRVSKDSPIYNFLPVYATIQSIDDCTINTSDDWYRCLKLINNRHPQQSSGYCLTSADIHLLANRIETNQTYDFDCCQNLFEKHYCFIYHTKNNFTQNGACMEARLITRHHTCLIDDDCQQQSRESLCVHPFSADNITRFMCIKHDQGPEILFVGTINEIFKTVQIQSYKSKYNFLPSIFITDIPLFFQYIGTFSFALAFFNAVPCYALDGQYILSSFIEYMLPNYYQRRHENISYALIFGTCLLIINVSLAFLRYFF